MNEQRYRQLEDNHELDLTKEELAEGWHWCYDWDGLLVGPGSDEALCCGCNSIIQEWKKSDEGKKMLDEQEAHFRETDKLDADAFNEQFRRTDGE